jgi:hypothetical protein
MTIQAIRLLDVFVIGPLMIAGAKHARTLPPLARFSLGFFGITTILYNGVNYLQEARTLEK